MFCFIYHYSLSFLLCGSNYPPNFYLNNLSLRFYEPFEESGRGVTFTGVQISNDNNGRPPKLSSLLWAPYGSKWSNITNVCLARRIHNTDSQKRMETDEMEQVCQLSIGEEMKRDNGFSSLFYDLTKLPLVHWSIRILRYIYILVRGYHQLSKNKKLAYRPKYLHFFIL